MWSGGLISGVFGIASWVSAGSLGILADAPADVGPWWWVALTGGASAMGSVIGYLYKEVRRLSNTEARCQARLASLEAEQVSMNALLEQMRWSGSGGMDAVIVADATTGTIIEWNPGATILLHWTAREMMGKPVTRIIPARYREAHLKAQESLRASARTPRRGPFQFAAVTKEGVEVPVEISLSGWVVGDQKFVAASIRRRMHDSFSESAPTAGEPS